MKKLGKTLRELRIEKNLSIKEFSKIVMTSRNTISRWENGTRTPSFEILLIYSRYFKVSMDYIFALED